MAILPISLETLSWVFIVILAVKLSVLLIKPKSWLDLVDKIYINPIVTMIVYAILAYLTLDILISSGITYVQIFAVTVFIVFLMGMSITIYWKDMSKLADKLLKNKHFWRKAWFPALIWVLLAVLTLNEMYAFW